VTEVIFLNPNPFKKVLYLDYIYLNRNHWMKSKSRPLLIQIWWHHGHVTCTSLTRVHAHVLGKKTFALINQDKYCCWLAFCAAPVLLVHALWI